jgi:hypothetical protein
MKFRDLQGSLTWEEFFMIFFGILEFWKDFKKSFQSWRSEYSLKTDLRKTRGAKNISKTVFKIRFKTKESITYTLVFVKYLVVSFRSPSIRTLSVFRKIN